LSFKSFDQLDRTSLGRLVAEVAQTFSADPDNPVRYKHG